MDIYLDYHLRCGYRYIGDEFGSFFVVKYVVEEAKIVQLPYEIAASSIFGTCSSSLLSCEYLVIYMLYSFRL